ncbi:hypothetical protein JW935_23240 [candidate division KSB1 bacterium]|nr:hypothetical protein [candidate division KSB1 bacterium]
MQESVNRTFADVFDSVASLYDTNRFFQISAEKLEIIHSEIRYKISIEDWWLLLNSAGYKGLLDQVGSHRIQEFKDRHYQQILNVSPNGEILLIADTYYTFVSKFSMKF